MSIYQIQLEKHIIGGNRIGNHLAVSARIHGNEPSGEIALRRVIREIGRREINIERGKLILWPTLNPFAKDLCVRGTWGDTNRSITERTELLTPEDSIFIQFRSRVGHTVFCLKDPMIWNSLKL